VQAYIRIRPREVIEQDTGVDSSSAAGDLNLEEHLVVDEISSSVALFPLQHDDVSSNSRPSPHGRRGSLPQEALSASLDRASSSNEIQGRPRQRSSSIDMLLHTKLKLGSSLQPSPKNGMPEGEKGKPKVFQFDGVMDPTARQDEVWDKVESLVDSAVRGYNGTMAQTHNCMIIHHLNRSRVSTVLIATLSSLPGRCLSSPPLYLSLSYY
jgi:hypothetical protein